MKHMFSRTFSILLLALVALSGCLSQSSQAEDTFKEGVQYNVIKPPIPTQAAADKVEVTELFWYGCPHCYALEPTIQTYLNSKPSSVVFQRVPATLSPRWTFHAKLYYVGVLLDPNGGKHLHSKIFDALQKQHRNINTDDSLVRFFTDQGFSAAQVTGALNSMEMKTMMARADTVGIKSGADSVPTVIVNGKYLTSPSMAGGEDKLLKVINYLVKLETK